jgi:hypothetical protein
VTAAGRGIAAFLMVAGIALFGILTANVAAFFVGVATASKKRTPHRRSWTRCCGAWLRWRMSYAASGGDASSRSVSLTSLDPGRLSEGERGSEHLRCERRSAKAGAPPLSYARDGRHATGDPLGSRAT